MGFLRLYRPLKKLLQAITLRLTKDEEGLPLAFALAGFTEPYPAAGAAIIVTWLRTSSKE